MESKGFSTKGERYTIFLCWLFHLPSTTCGTPPQTTGLISASSESQPSSSDAKTQLIAFSQISAHASGAWCHPNTLVSIPIWDFYFDISEWHILSARAWITALMLHLTNPSAKRKVLSLTKPKGKIYKTKSLGHYITWIQTCSNPLKNCPCVAFYSKPKQRGCRSWCLVPESGSSRIFRMGCR